MDIASVRAYLTGLQDRIVGQFAELDGKSFLRDEWQRPEGGGGVSRLVEEGNLLERGGVGFSHVLGTKQPPSASAHRPEIAGRPWEAMGVSLVFHPRNPYVPTVHMNVRFFAAKSPDGDAAKAVWCSDMGRKFGGREGDLPVTERISDQLVRLPFHNGLTSNEQEQVVDAILSFSFK